MADKWADKWANSEKNEDNCMRTLHLLMNSRCSVFCALRMCLRCLPVPGIMTLSIIYAIIADIYHG